MGGYLQRGSKGSSGIYGGMGDTEYAQGTQMFAVLRHTLSRVHDHELTRGFAPGRTGGHGLYPRFHRPRCQAANCRI